MNYDVIVVGAGHAGVEAAAAASRLGVRVALITRSAADLGTMSCNPSIGGIGKGHLVREVDALGGVIGGAADNAAIHRRMLNRSKGPAVWGPRVQADRKLFALAVRRAIDASPRIKLIYDEVIDLTCIAGRIVGVVTSSGRIDGRAVVVATGTFLRGRLHHGLVATDGGRDGGSPSIRLADRLKEAIGTPLRGKTGTPPRLDGRTIDWARVQRQATDVDQWWMGIDRSQQPPQVHCAITHTGDETRDLILGASDQSPLYSGRIAGRGPRYCPSMEDKMRRFPDRSGHQIFLEPEVLVGHSIYPNGLSTSLPPFVQERLVRTIPGLGRTSITVPGYAVEYDYFDPRHLSRSLETISLAALFFAGQINGTTGYEEAAAQGLVAGINAARVARELPPCHFSRTESYLGVLVDDLTLQGVDEPYRMLTARAESRLHLRADNAEARCGPLALEIGLLSQERRNGYERRCRARLGGGFGDLDAVDRIGIEREMAADALYAPYVKRQQAENAKLAREDRLPLDESCYERVAGLSNEMKDRLARARPATLGEAKRINGITPAALASLLVAVTR